MKKLSSPIALIKKSFDIFFEKQNFISFLKIYAWLLPFQIFFLYQNFFLTTQSKVLNTTDTSLILSKNTAFLIVVIIVNLLFFVASAWAGILGIKMIIAINAGKPPSVKKIYQSTWKRLLPFLVLQVFQSFLVGLGLILLIIPGIILAVWYSFSRLIFVDKEAGAIESLKMSKSLVKGRFFPVFGRLIVFGAFGILFELFFASVPYGIGSVVSLLFGALLLLPAFLLYRELTG